MINTLSWKKSSRCGTGACVEVAGTPDVVHVRDSKDPNSPVLSFEPTTWAAFIDNLRGGEGSN